jgi:acyl dehydratase
MFYIKESEGTKFAKLSGDNNVVHFDKIAGNNSIYGYKIVHGVFVSFIFFKNFKITKTPWTIL